ncbi:uncharacterized protein DMAD_05940 [Drosophila madeirensis]|uniref:Uncharacterized protein n=1 Tax=Drosophila madeirensis TaxID=30013 RepID=A0AAU9FP00_DROMD
MNLVQGSLGLLLALTLAIVAQADVPVRPPTSKDIACGDGRYYNYARRVCLPW